MHNGRYLPYFLISDYEHETQMSLPRLRRLLKESWAGEGERARNQNLMRDFP